MSYTPGYTELADRLMSRRTATSHAWLALPLVEPGATVVDVGCGAGSITCDLARRVRAGRVIGVDASALQLERAGRRAAAEGVAVDLVEGAVEDLPLADSTAEVTLAHALLEHVADPGIAVRELVRITRPGGHVVAISPDLGGWLLAPADAAAERAIDAYAAIQSANGGDLTMGRQLGALLAAAGLADVAVDARYEVYEDSGLIADYLAERIEASPELDAERGPGLDAEDAARLAGALRRWARRPASAFCQAWVGARGGVRDGAGASRDPGRMTD